MQVTGYIPFIKYLASFSIWKGCIFFSAALFLMLKIAPKDFFIYILTSRINYVIYNSLAQRGMDLLVGQKKTTIFRPKSISPLGFYNCLIINEILFFSLYLLNSVLKLKHYILRL